MGWPNQPHHDRSYDDMTDHDDHPANHVSADRFDHVARILHDGTDDQLHLAVELLIDHARADYDAARQHDDGGGDDWTRPSSTSPLASRRRRHLMAWTEDELMEMLSAALDEIYALRRGLIYEARVSEVHGGYKTFPKTRRQALEDQVARMRQAVAEGATGTYTYQSMRGVPHTPETLTTTEWMAEIRKR